jgi:hypothetical protein
MPTYIVNPLLVKGQSVILFSPDTASGLLFAQQLTADILAGNNFLGQYPTLAGSVLQVADQSRQADWNRLISLGSTVLLATGNTVRDPGVVDSWVLTNPSGSNYSLRIPTANLVLSLTKSGAVFTFQSSQVIIDTTLNEVRGVPGIYCRRVPLGWIW